MNRTGITAAGGFLAAIIGANAAVTHYGLVPVGLGLMAPAGVYLAGATFVLRDTIHDRYGKRAVIALIAIGAVLSAVISPALAIASGVAFLLSELADLAIYAPLRRRGYIRAAIASNIAGSIVDSILFLTLAGIPLAFAPGQIIGKLWITAAVVLAVAATRRARTVTA